MGGLVLGKGEGGGEEKIMVDGLCRRGRPLVSQNCKRLIKDGISRELLVAGMTYIPTDPGGQHDMFLRRLLKLLKIILDSMSGNYQRGRSVS